MALLDAVAFASREPLLRAVSMFAVVGVGFIANMLRSLPLYLEHKLGFVRPPQDSEIFGLKLSLMVLPIFTNISSTMHDIYTAYTRSAPLINENKMTDLGL